MGTLDTAPTSAKRFYAVTSVDALGNESGPSATREITFPVAPARNILLTRVDDGKPSLSWEAGEGNLQGYYIYRNGSKINTTPTSSTSFSDGYYNGGAVTYGVSAVNSLGTESPIKEVALPVLNIGLKEGTTLRRGMMETVTLIASLPADAASGVNIDSVNLKIGNLPESTESGPFTVTPATPLEVRKVAATEATAPPQVAVVTTAILNPSPGTTVKITKSSVASVLGSGTALEIFNEPLVRGTTGKVRIKVNNLGSARTEFLTSENNGPTGQVKVSLKDQDGNILAQGNLNQRAGSMVVNSGSYATARLEPGESFLSDPITFTVPATAPYRVVLEAVIANTWYHYNQLDQVVAPGLKQSAETTIADVSYMASATTDKVVYRQGEKVVISGQATSTATSQPMPLVPVRIGLSVKGFDRFFTVNTDSTGAFSYTFTPASNEAGSYSVWAIHPDLSDRTVQAQFSIIGLAVSPTLANITILKGQSYDIPVTLANLGGSPLTGLTLTPSVSSGITATVPNPGAATLAAGESRTVTFRITSGANSSASGYASLAIATAEGLSDKVDANVSLVSAIPVISTSPSYIDTGLVRGTQRIESLTIRNTGMESLRNARIEGPSIPWLALTVEKNLGDIPAGQNKSVGILMKPADIIPQGVYNDRLVIYSDNHIPYTCNIQVTVTSSAVGSVQFDVLNELMKDVSGASITLQNQSLTELIYNLKTAADGTASIFDIPEGRYSFNISASGHKPYSGSFVITPGVTTTVPIALEMTLVQVEWSVTPVLIEDRYQITVSQTFETNVPTPVLVTEPPGVTLPELAPGQVYNGEFTISNYGLIALNDVSLQFPTSFGEYDVEILATVPKTLNAMQKVTVPYRIIRRQQTALLDTGGEGSIKLASIGEEVGGYGGTPCYASFTFRTTGTAIICPGALNERTVTKTADHYVSSPIPGSNCGGSTGYTGGVQPVPTYGYTTGSGGAQSGGGSTPSGASSITPIATNDENCIYPRTPNSKPNPDCQVCTGSYVDVGNGSYIFSETDFTIPARSIPIELERTYRSNQIMKASDKWSFAAPMDSPFGFGWHSPWFSRAGDGMFLDGDGYYYEFTKDSAGKYLPHMDAGLSLTKTSSGYEVRKRGGNIHQFGANGKLKAIKDNNGNTITLNYDTADKLVSITDATGRVALTFAYDARNHITTATDLAGRAINYEYDENGNMTKVLRGQTVVSNYEYDLSPNIVRPIVCSYGTFTGPIYENGIYYNGTVSGYTCGDPTGFEQNSYNTFHNMIKRNNALGETYRIAYKLAWRSKGIVEKVTDPQGRSSSFVPGFVGGVFYNTDYAGTSYKRVLNDKGQLVRLSEASLPLATDSGITGSSSGSGGSGGTSGSVGVEYQSANNEKLIKSVEYLPGRIEKITDGAGNVTTIQKDEWGNVISSTDGEGNTTRITYNADAKPLAVTDPLGVVTRFEYDTNGNLVKAIRAEGKPEESVTTYSYDSYGQLTGSTTEGATVAVAYNSNGQPVSVTDPLGNVAKLEYDRVGNLAAQVDAAGNRTELTYDDWNKLKTVKDPLGSISTYGYNLADRLNSVKDPLNRVTEIETDFAGRTTAIVDPLKNRKEFQYDGRGNLTRVTEGDAVTSMSYDSGGKLTTLTDPEGNITRYEYASAGCATCGGSTETPKKITDPLGNVTESIFDKAGRVTGIQDPLGYVTSLVRDAAGGVTSRLDANGNLTKYHYDALGRINSQTDANGGETAFTYDKRGNLTSLTDPEGNTTTFAYDLAGRKTKETRPMGQAAEYSYFPNGLLKSAKDGKNQTTTYGYDKANRLTEITYADGTKHTFNYDATGNMTGYASPEVSATITYDAANRKTSETVTMGGFTKSYAYTYNANGNKASFTTPGNVTYNYTYNKNGQPTQITTPAGNITLAYQWDRLTKVALPNGITADYAYNANSWLTDIKASNTKTAPPIPLASATYSFDKVGDITTKTTEAGNHSYGYDSTYQLTSTTIPTLPQEAYTYDKVGNRKTSVQTQGPWSYNKNNELLSYNGTSFTYDANGNTIFKTENNQTTTYNFGATDRLASVNLPDGRTASYTYDPFGRRIRKQVGNEVTYYLYADEGLIGEYDAAGNLKKGYGWNPDGIWGTDPLFMVENGNCYFYQNNHLGTPQKLTDGDGNIVWSAEYEAFGKAHVDPASPVISNLRFPGQYYDGDTGLYYNWHRYFDPDTGRYTQVDPIRFAAEDENLYRYVQNNVVGIIDEKGLKGGTFRLPPNSIRRSINRSNSRYRERLNRNRTNNSIRSLEQLRNKDQKAAHFGIELTSEMLEYYNYVSDLDEEYLYIETPAELYCPDKAPSNDKASTNSSCHNGNNKVKYVKGPFLTKDRNSLEGCYLLMKTLVYRKVDPDMDKYIYQGIVEGGYKKYEKH